MIAKSKLDGHSVEWRNNEWVFSETGAPVITYESFCMDCHKPYKLFGLDTTIPDDQWEMIHSEIHGVLCANCIVERASKLTGVIAVRAEIEFSRPAR